MIAFLQTSLLALSLQALAAADGPITAVQDALKRQQFFVGEPNGVLDEPTRDALRRFQIRQGLPASGEIDTATLQALQGPPATTASVPPVEPRDISGPAPSKTVVKKDREFLEKLEKAEPRSEQIPNPAPQAAPPAPLAPSAPPAIVNETSQRPPPEPAQPSEVVPQPPPPSTAEIPASAAVERKPRPQDPKPGHNTRRLETSSERSASPVAAVPPARDTEEVAPRVTKPRKSATPANRRPPQSENVANAATTDREARPKAATAPPGAGEVDPDPLAPHGVRIIRSTTTKKGPDGRTYVEEKTTTTSSGTVAPEIRRAEPVEPPRKSRTFLDRLFKDNDDD